MKKIKLILIAFMALLLMTGCGYKGDSSTVEGGLHGEITEDPSVFMGGKYLFIKEGFYDYETIRADILKNGFEEGEYYPDEYFQYSENGEFVLALANVRLPETYLGCQLVVQYFDLNESELYAPNTIQIWSSGSEEDLIEIMYSKDVSTSSEQEDFKLENYVILFDNNGNLADIQSYVVSTNPDETGGYDYKNPQHGVSDIVRNNNWTKVANDLEKAYRTYECMFKNTIDMNVLEQMFKDLDIEKLK